MYCITNEEFYTIVAIHSISNSIHSWRNKVLLWGHHPIFNRQLLFRKIILLDSNPLIDN